MIDVSAIAAAYPIESNALRYINFFLECLQYVEDKLPLDAQAGLRVARQFWGNHMIDGNDLDAELRKCTSHFVYGSGVDAPYRLVSFVLSAPVGSAAENLDWFDHYSELVGIPNQLLENAAEKSFPLRNR